MGTTPRARLTRRVRARLAAEGGFTLVELLITMAILLIVIASLASVLVSASRSEVDANKRFQAQGQARAALDQLRRELHCSTSATVKNSSGTTLSAGAAGAAVTAILGSACPTNVTHAPTLYVTWCTAGSTLVTGDFALYRVSSAASAPTCTSAGKVKWGDYLQTSTPFCLPGTTAASACNGVLKPSTSLPMLHVTMPVDLNGPTSTIDKYNLVDDIALRNGTRS